MRNLCLTVLLLGCTTTVTRDRDVYLSEMTFIDRLVHEGAPANRELVVQGCICANGVWRANTAWATDTACLRYAEWWMVYTSRWTWHINMMLFNAGLRATRPGPAPTIPEVSCTLPADHAE